MLNYEYKSLIRDFDRFYRQDKKDKIDYIERVIKFVHELSQEFYDKKDELSEENITHRLRLLKIASLCAGTFPTYLPRVQEEIEKLTVYTKFMAESQISLYNNIIEKLKILTNENED